MNLNPLISWWGAATGTVALGIQIRHWRVDRAVLNIRAEMQTIIRDRPALFLTVHAVNVGRRPHRVKEVVAELHPDCGPRLPPEQAAKLTKISNLVYLHHPRDRGSVELAPDGGECTWEIAVPPGVRFLTKLEAGEEYGKGYVKLTSGRKMSFKFLKTDLPPLHHA